MNKFLVFDLETNDKEVCDAEIIDGAFCITDSSFNIIDTHRMLSQVNKWSEEAEAIHGIRYADTLAYPKKDKAYHDLFEFLSKHKPYKPVCYSNPNNFGNFYHYDIAVIKMQLNYLYNNHVLFYHYFSDDIYSPYLKIKELHKNKVINIAPHETLTQFSLENVYLNLFNETYNSHKSIDDTKALLKLCKEILRLESNGNILFNALDGNNRQKEIKETNTELKLL
jgi:DNA polymerase III epsilon subunit-like protein